MSDHRNHPNGYPPPYPPNHQPPHSPYRQQPTGNSNGQYHQNGQQHHGYPPYGGVYPPHGSGYPAYPPYILQHPTGSSNGQYHQHLPPQPLPLLGQPSPTSSRTERQRQQSRETSQRHRKKIREELLRLRKNEAARIVETVADTEKKKEESRQKGADTLGSVAKQALEAISQGTDVSSPIPRKNKKRGASNSDQQPSSKRAKGDVNDTSIVPYVPGTIKSTIFDNDGKVNKQMACISVRQCVTSAQYKVNNEPDAFTHDVVRLVNEMSQSLKQDGNNVCHNHRLQDFDEQKVTYSILKHFVTQHQQKTDCPSSHVEAVMKLYGEIIFRADSKQCHNDFKKNQSQVAHLKQKNEEYNRQISNMKSDIAAMKEQSKSREAEYDQRISKLKDSNAAIAKKLMDKAKEKQEMAEEMNRAVAEKQEMAEEMKRVIEEKEQVVKEMEDLAASVKHLLTIITQNKQISRALKKEKMD